MDNEMINEVVTTEAAEVATQVAETSKNDGLKYAALAGGIMALGALAWEFGVKPVARKIKTVIKKAKDKRKEKPAVKDEDIIEGDIEDPEEEFPID